MRKQDKHKRKQLADRKKASIMSICGAWVGRDDITDNWLAEQRAGWNSGTTKFSSLFAFWDNPEDAVYDSM